jgi:hypothetical protein
MDGSSSRLVKWMAMAMAMAMAMVMLIDGDYQCTDLMGR